MKKILKRYFVWALFKYPNILKINIDFNDGGHWPWETHSSEFQSNNVQSENNFNLHGIFK
jgi:hypothetical protein